MKILCVFLLGVASLAAADAPSPVGDWHGALDVGSIQLRLALHVQQSSPGQLKSTLDSLDQGANGIPASATTFEGGQLKLEFPNIKGSYAAAISADGKTLDGTWTQNGNSLPLKLMRGVPPPPPPDPAAATVQPLAGSWQAVLETPGGKLPLVLHIRKDDKGNMVSTLDSPDQKAIGMPVSGLSLKSGAFHFDVKLVGGSYDGTVDEKLTAIKGTWRQGPGELPLEFSKR